MLASVAEQASLSLTWSETPEDTFSHDEAHIDLYRNKHDSLFDLVWYMNILCSERKCNKRKEEKTY